MKERVRVELAYLALLMKLGVAPKSKVPRVEVSLDRVKALEARLGHDVKATEVYLREFLTEVGSPQLAPYVHLGLTSEDTNSVAYGILLSSALKDVLIPSYSRLATALARLAGRESSTAMLARTHGQPAVPTTFGKEVAVFAFRIAGRVSMLKKIKPMAKVSGAVGTYASFGLLGVRDWQAVLRRFVSGMGLEAAPYSTQVVPGERLSDILHFVININQLMFSLSRDLWLYQTLGYLHFIRRGKVSSSTMPQKVNPVDLENAEGQVEISNSLLTMLAYRLQLTRMQRDLSDSVIRRMLGQALAHSLVASGRLQASLNSMRVDRGAMASDLDRHPEVFAEREQMMMRLEGDEKGYEKVKSSLERGKFVPTSKASDGYLGLARILAEDCPRLVADMLRA